MTSTPPPPPPAGSGAMDGFFDSLRRMNLHRSQERWIGGVAGGIGARLGIDPLIVRGVLLVMTLFGGLGLLVYGLGWALLPEAADGRIHLQEAFRGRFDAALVGAIVFTVIGLSRVGFWWDGWFGIPYMIGVLALVALVVVIAVAVRGSGKPGHTGTTAPPSSGGSVPFSTAQPGQSDPAQYSAGPGAVPGAQSAPGEHPADEQAAAGPWAEGPWGEEPPPVGAPQASGSPDPAAGVDAAEQRASSTEGGAWATGQDAGSTEQGTWATGQDAGSTEQGTWATGQDAGSAGHAGHPPTPPPPVTPPPAQPPQPARPPKPTRPGPGRVLVRVTFGVALLLIAGLALVSEYYGWPASAWNTGPWFVALGAGLVVLGLGATIAGLLGRRSGSLGVIGTVLAIVLVPWAITASMVSGYNYTSAAGYGERHWMPQSSAQAAEGYDLTAGTVEVDLSALADETVTTPVDINLLAGEVILLVPDEMPVTVTTSVVGDVTAVNLSDWSATVNGKDRPLGQRTDVGWQFGTTAMTAELTSPEADDATPLEVNVDVTFGTVEVRELP